ncbi:MAG: polysaccharide deacetylase family protein [Methylobacter sp.]|nr:polysaccharide deacetylase family protein [Methylobacter sp.]
MKIALKVDVDTLRGTLEGVPALLALFRQYSVNATFLFSLGPDHTGRALRRLFRPGFFSKVKRTSVLSHYGLKTLLYGTVLPGPKISLHGRHILRHAEDAGHEVGIHCYDHIRWQDFVAHRDADWTKREMQSAINAFHEVFGHPPSVHGAAGWQVNKHMLQLEQQLGFRYASDCRGYCPFIPFMEGQSYPCPQIPSTLPTLDELIGRHGITEDNVHTAIFAASREPVPFGHVYTLHAELEGMKLLPVMEKLLQLWQQAGDEACRLQDYITGINIAKLPHHELVWGGVEGRSGVLALQGREIY